MLYLFARFHARDGCAGAVRAAIKEVEGPTLAEPGCNGYRAFHSIRDANEFYIHSVWMDAAAFDLHARLPHTLKFLTTVEPLVDHPIYVSLTEPLNDV